MKKYSAPKSEIQIFTCEDIVAINYSEQGTGDVISWDDFLRYNP